MGIPGGLDVDAPGSEVGRNYLASVICGGGLRDRKEEFEFHSKGEGCRDILEVVRDEGVDWLRLNRWCGLLLLLHRRNWRGWLGGCGDDIGDGGDWDKTGSNVLMVVLHGLNRLGEVVHSSKGVAFEKSLIIFSSWLRG